MKVRDIVQNRDFDANCEVDVYDSVGDDGEDWTGKTPLATISCGTVRAEDEWVLDRTVTYITTDLTRGSIVIESH